MLIPTTLNVNNPLMIKYGLPAAKNFLLKNLNFAKISVNTNFNEKIRRKISATGFLKLDDIIFFVQQETD